MIFPVIGKNIIYTHISISHNVVLIVKKSQVFVVDLTYSHDFICALYGAIICKITSYYFINIKLSVIIGDNNMHIQL